MQYIRVPLVLDLGECVESLLQGVGQRLSMLNSEPLFQAQELAFHIELIRPEKVMVPQVTDGSFPLSREVDSGILRGRAVSIDHRDWWHGAHLAR